MKQDLVVSAEEAGERLDRYVSDRLPELSRTRVQELIDEGLLQVDGRRLKSAHRLRAGERISIEPRARPQLDARAEDVPLDVLYEDDDVLVVNKPAGMTVHAGAGRTSGTLVNALLGRGQGLSGGSEAFRPGIVHRLDRETSGAIIVAKSDAAHAHLAEQFRARGVKKTYLALVEGYLERARGRIELAIARDPKRRVRMAPVGPKRPAGPKAREARTDWRVLTTMRAKQAPRGGFTLAEVQLHTGRTHQIRVHFAALRHPVVGDTLYGAAKVKQKGGLPASILTGSTLGRNFLHAAKIGFEQPRTGKWIEVTAPLPQELREYLHRLAEALGRAATEIDARIRSYL
ncbi:MAG: RluA family pseudouridine synthase [Candidatus Acidiferrales bacterium]|jgi:23S rRNA pseudouridine1911/1915/1917 synthase